MALNTQTLLSLMQKLGESTSDFLEFSTTTNITTDNYIISTTLGQYDESEDDHFGGADTEWWAYITEGTNVGVHRRTSDYSAASTRITVEGAALAAETAAVTCRLYHYNRDHMKNAIIEACKEVYPALHVDLEDTTLITGNIIPDASFEDWSSSTALNHFTRASTADALARQSAAGSIRNGTYAARFTAGTANSYFYVSSNSYPKLLDLQDQTVDFYCWVYPEVADDPKITVYTINAAGSTQTLASTTAAPATKWSLLKRENMSLNDDLHEIQLRWVVATSTKYTIFDDALLGGRRMYEYLLPNDFRDGHLSNAFMQTYGNFNPACYDYHPFSTINPGVELPFDIIPTSTQRSLMFDQTPPTRRRLRLLGYKPLETLSADTDTITIDAHRVPLLIARARMIFWEREAVPISSQDKGRFEYEYNKAERDYRRHLTKMRMILPTQTYFGIKRYMLWGIEGREYGRTGGINR